MHKETTQLSNEVIHIADIAQFPTITENFTRFKVLNCVTIFDSFTIYVATVQCSQCFNRYVL